MDSKTVKLWGSKMALFPKKVEYPFKKNLASVLLGTMVEALCLK